MELVGAYGRVGELVSQRIVIAKILMTIATINQIPAYQPPFETTPLRSLDANKTGINVAN